MKGERTTSKSVRSNLQKERQTERKKEKRVKNER